MFSFHKEFRSIRSKSPRDKVPNLDYQPITADIVPPDKLISVASSLEPTRSAAPNPDKQEGLRQARAVELARPVRLVLAMLVEATLATRAVLHLVDLYLLLQQTRCQKMNFDPKCFECLD